MRYHTVYSFWGRRETVAMVIGTICIALSISGCQFRKLNPYATQTDQQIEDLAGAPPATPPTYIDKDARFRSALLVASKPTATKEDILKYLDTGVAVARFRCESYFKDLAVRNADTGFAHGAIDASGVFTTALLGFLKVASSAVGGFGAGLGLVGSSFKSYNDNYLPSPDLPALEDLVSKTQGEMEKQILGDQAPKTYPAAERDLLQYDTICTYIGMKTLLNQAVAAAQPVVTTGGPTCTDLKSPLADRQMLGGIISGGVTQDLTCKQVVGLYWLYVTKPDNATRVQHLATLLDLLGGIANQVIVAAPGPTQGNLVFADPANTAAGALNKINNTENSLIAKVATSTFSAGGGTPSVRVKS